MKTEEELEEFDYKLEDDFERGQELKDKIIPYACEYFMGESIEVNENEELVNDDDKESEESEKDEKEERKAPRKQEQKNKIKKEKVQEQVQEKVNEKTDEERKEEDCKNQ